MFFEQLTLRGSQGWMRWGYQTAAVLRGWTIRQNGPGWSLMAGVDRADPFQLTTGAHDTNPTRRLRFHAPRKGGFWCWPVVAVTLNRDYLTAQLDPPEQ